MTDITDLYTDPQEITERKERVKTADTLFSWECTPPRNLANDWFLFILASVISGVAGYLMRTDVIAMTIGIVVPSLVIAFLSFTAFQPHHYKYELTREGIRVTDEERVPEIVFTIVRGLAWFGVIACLIAVVVVGPMAFVGAGAAALGAFSFTGFKKEAGHYVYLFHHYAEIRYFESDYALGVFPIMDKDPNNIRSRLISDLHVNPAELDDVVNQIKQVIDVSEVKFVECSTELVI
ncbi:hypothetical protein [Vibrio sp. WXL103]|uniref:hypothetical protein n=1 Tax=Vibrio sp. WXL103 TaxID=3450710 RepID=UPI003EC78D22